MINRELVIRFREQCKAQGLAFTHQRQVIYQAIVGSDEHPTPEAIYERVRRQVPSISLGTIYKNLNTFLEAGLLQEVSLHHGSLRVDARMEPHHHYVCRRCRRITDLDAAAIRPVRVPTTIPAGFHVERQNMEIIGICESCSKKIPTVRKGD